MNRLYAQPAVIFFGAALLTHLTWAPVSSAGEAKGGKATYDKLCASCHGADGKGNPAMAKALGEKGLNLTTKEVKAAKDDDLLKVIAEGRGKMPASGKSLSKPEQKEILDFVRSLGK
jgi:mono/diheme cytochrome c family protein